MLAAVNGRENICRYLIEQKADVNLGDNYVNSHKTGAAVGMHPVEGIFVWFFKFLHLILIDFDACFLVLMIRDEEFCSRLNNRATFLGCTALHYAVLADELETVELLLQNGADPLIENDSGHKPLQYATDGPIRKVLEEYTEKVIITVELVSFLILFILLIFFK